MKKESPRRRGAKARGAEDIASFPPKRAAQIMTLSRLAGRWEFFPSSGHGSRDRSPHGAPNPFIRRASSDGWGRFWNPSPGPLPRRAMGLTTGLRSLRRRRLPSNQVRLRIPAGRSRPRRHNGGRAHVRAMGIEAWTARSNVLDDGSRSRGLPTLALRRSNSATC